MVCIGLLVSYSDKHKCHMLLGWLVLWCLSFTIAKSHLSTLLHVLSLRTIYYGQKDDFSIRISSYESVFKEIDYFVQWLLHKSF